MGTVDSGKNGFPEAAIANAARLEIYAEEISCKGGEHCETKN